MNNVIDKPFYFAGKTYNSRLIIGSGKYKNFQENLVALETSGAQIITVAIRRVNLGQNSDEPSLLDVVSPRSTQSFPIPQAAIPLRMLFAPVVWLENY